MRLPFRKSTGNDKREIVDVADDEHEGTGISLVNVKTSFKGEGKADDVGDVLGDDRLDSVDVVVVFEQLLLSLHLLRSSSDDSDSDTLILHASPSDAVRLSSQVAPSVSSIIELLFSELADVGFKAPLAFKLCSNSNNWPIKFKFGEIIGRFCFTRLYASKSESD